MIVVVDYKMGNLHSVSKALEMVGADVVITSDPADLEKCDGIVLPGVGSFRQGMENLNNLGLVETLNREIIERQKPMLGICLGMQLAARFGEEEGPTEGLGWLDADVLQLVPESDDCKIPHIGWNDVEFDEHNPLFKGIRSPASFYFVHSFHFVYNLNSVMTSTCDHGGTFLSSLSKENIQLVQFHPEKSQDIGLQVLENFLELV